MAELSQNTQTKLLRVLENGEFIPIGSNETLRINVRFVAATNKNLKEEVCKGHFREDLFYRLNVLCLDLPPLRERKNDIPLLVGHFLKNYQKKYRELSPISLIQRVSETAMDILKAYSWPGNIRELENTLQRAFTQINEGETVLEPKHFDFLEDIQKGSTRKYNFPEFQKGFELEEHLAEYEKGIISRALERDQGNLTKTAKSLGISFRALRYKVKKYKL